MSIPYPSNVAARNLKVGHHIVWSAALHVTVTAVDIDDEEGRVYAYYGGYVPAEYGLRQRVPLHWDR